MSREEVPDGQPRSEQISLDEGDHESVSSNVARLDVIKLTAVGVVLLIVGGLGTWSSKWDTGLFTSVEVAADRHLAIGYRCGSDSRIEVDENDDRVEITLTERAPSDDQDCVNVRCITLERPVEARPVINGGTGVEVFVIRVEALAGCPPGDR